MVQEGTGALLVDAHAHLDDPWFADDLDAVLARAAAAGVAAMVTAGVNLESSAAAVRLAETYPAVYAAVGFHPHEASRFQPDYLAQLRDWCAHPKVVAIGECGLDFYYKHSPRGVQRQVLQAHLDLAAEVGMPVVLHCREASAALEGLLRPWAGTGSTSLSPSPRGMVHCFSGDPALASRLVALGFCISLAGPVTFANARKLPEVAQVVPLEALLVETDSPYLAPHPYRGQRNEPARVAVTAQRVAELRGVDLAVLAQATTANAIRLFGLSLAAVGSRQGR